MLGADYCGAVGYRIFAIIGYGFGSKFRARRAESVDRDVSSQAMAAATELPRGIERH
jgi:hypothetical protein